MDLSKGAFGECVKPASIRSKATKAPNYWTNLIGRLRKRKLAEEEEKVDEEVVTRNETDEVAEVDEEAVTRNEMDDEAVVDEEAVTRNEPDEEAGVEIPGTRHWSTICRMEPVVKRARLEFDGSYTFPRRLAYAGLFECEKEDEHFRIRDVSCEVDLTCPRPNNLAVEADLTVSDRKERASLRISTIKLPGYIGECTVCLGPVKEDEDSAKLGPCDHPGNLYHIGCATEMMKTFLQQRSIKRRCPFCRRQVFAFTITEADVKCKSKIQGIVENQPSGPPAPSASQQTYLKTIVFGLNHNPRNRGPQVTIGRWTVRGNPNVAPFIWNGRPEQLAPAFKVVAEEDYNGGSIQEEDEEEAVEDEEYEEEEEHEQEQEQEQEQEEEEEEDEEEDDDSEGEADIPRVPTPFPVQEDLEAHGGFEDDTTDDHTEQVDADLPCTEWTVDVLVDVSTVREANGRDEDRLGSSTVHDAPIPSHEEVTVDVHFQRKEKPTDELRDTCFCGPMGLPRCRSSCWLYDGVACTTCNPPKPPACSRCKEAYQGKSDLHVCARFIPTPRYEFNIGKNPPKYGCCVTTLTYWAVEVNSNKASVSP